MAKHGYVAIDEGTSAVVYRHPKRPGVVKVWAKSDRFYNAYLKRVLENQHLANVPQIYGGVSEFDAHYAVRMEELTHRTDQPKCSCNGEKEHHQNPLEEEAYRGGLKAIAESGLASTAILWRLAKWIESETFYSTDFSYGPNIMQRDNGVPVFIDPW